MMISMRAVLVVAVAALAGCTKHVSCDSDADCKDPAFPFCDVNGEFPASGGEKNVCTIVPDNCPVDRCGCTPGAVLSCAGDQITTCAADGKSTASDTCSLGCAADGTRCLAFDPSNGLGGALADSATEPSVLIPAGSTIYTDLGTIVDGAGVPISIKSVVVAQSGGPSIRAFIAGSLTVDGAVVRGSSALALVANGQLTIEGTIDGSAHGATAGVAGTEAPSPCVGGNTQEMTCSATVASGGGAGGGNATTGGAAPGTIGGAPNSGPIPLLGGCRGGDLLDTSGTILTEGGGGGGATEIVSGQAISLMNGGFINLAGGGGGSSTGGGSGGTLLLEAPIVTITGAATGVTANGGSGGGCNLTGQDGGTGTTAAAAPGCSSGNNHAGSGGTGLTAPTAGAGCVMTPCNACSLQGGGGGAAGRLRVATKDGSYSSTSSPVLSIAISTATLQTR